MAACPTYATTFYSKLDSEDDKLSLSSKRESKLDIATKQGDTAFHIALRKGHGQAARELAKAGCNVTMPGSRGESALHLAASRGIVKNYNGSYKSTRWTFTKLPAALPANTRNTLPRRRTVAILCVTYTPWA